MPTEAQTIKELQDFTVRLQKQINDLSSMFKQTIDQLTDTSTPADMFEEKVWESAIAATISSMTNTSQVLPSDPKVIDKMMIRALHNADKWVEAAKTYKTEKERQRKEQRADPIKDLLDQ